MTRFDYQQQGVTLRQLRYFVVIAEELHFRRAAERLHMSQPPLSAAIADLERALMTRVFVRSRRHVALTDAGEALLAGARRVLEDFERALETARLVGQGHAGTLRIGFVGSAVYGLLPDIMRAYGDARPGVELHAREQPSTDQLEALRSGGLDVGFVRGPIEDERLRLRVVQRERTLAALRHDHPLARRSRVPLAKLGGESFVLFPREQAPGFHDALVAGVASAGKPARIVQEVPEMHTIIGLVAAGIGISLVPESVAALARAGVVYRVVPGAPRSELIMVTAPEPEPPLLAAFLDAVSAVVSKSVR